MIDTAPPVVLAQQQQQEEFPGAENSAVNDDGSRKPAELTQPTVNTVNAATTAYIAGFIDRIANNCRGLQAQYRLGCLTVEMRSLADRLPRRGDYGEAKQALDRVAKELEGITRRARDRRQPQIRTTVQRPKGAPETTGAITAIKASAAPKALAQAEAALQKGKLTLLRSASKGGPRQPHYERIAQAFDGSAVLLRS